MLSTISYPTESERLASSLHGRREGEARISVRHQLRADSPRTTAVQQLEWAIRGFNFEPNGTIRCEVALFEIAGDDQLHCNVTHRDRTQSVHGWAGPGNVPNGFVHNRRFRDTPHKDVIGHIREMVFAARV